MNRIENYLLAIYFLLNPIQTFAQQKCPDGQHDSGSMPGMEMCVPDKSDGVDGHDMSGMMGTSMLDFKLDQYLIGISESGPLG